MPEPTCPPCHYDWQCRQGRCANRRKYDESRHQFLVEQRPASQWGDGWIVIVLAVALPLVIVGVVAAIAGWFA